MNKRTTSAGLAALLLVAACTDAVGPARHAPDAPRFATQAPGTTGIVLDQMNGKLRDQGTEIWQGFQPTNPHNGDAIVVTFSWLGSTNTIDSVTDVLTTTPFTPVGNKYTRSEEHTSELQSQSNLVCRLLLEKKKKTPPREHNVNGASWVRYRAL